VRECDRRAEQRSVLHVAPGAHEIRSDDGFSVTGFKCVECAQPESDSDSGDQPSCAQLGLMQELR